MGEQKTDLIERLEEHISGAEDIAVQAYRRAFETQYHVNRLEEELHRISERFAGDLIAEIADRFKRFIDNRELTGMSNEEFNYELQQLLFQSRELDE